jgi:heme A synthase
MESPWLHRYSVVVSVCTALLFISGPVVSSNEERPLYSLGQTHAWLGAAVSLLVAGLAIGLSRMKERAWLRRLVWGALGASILQDLMAIEAGPPPTPARIFHVLLGQLLFSTTVAVAIVTSKGWNLRPKPVEDGSLPRFLATATPAVVLLQIALGAAFRHGVTDALPHILGAFVVAVFLGPTLAAILRTQHPQVRPAGIAFSVLVSLQILLGFGLLTMQALDVDPLVMIVATTAHAALGALTLAAAVVMALQIRRVMRAAGGHEPNESPSAL